MKIIDYKAEINAKNPLRILCAQPGKFLECGCRLSYNEGTVPKGIQYSHAAFWHNPDNAADSSGA
jgi:hypothetical protein